MAFLSDKAMIVWVFMFMIGVGIATAQYIYADVYGITLKDVNGQPLKDVVLQISNINTINTLQGGLNQLNGTNIQTNPVGVASGIASVSVTLIEVILGVYVFDILYHLGVPLIFIAAMIAAYVIFVGRAVLGWIKGVF